MEILNVIFLYLLVYVLFIGGLKVFYYLNLNIKLNFLIWGVFYIFGWYFDCFIKMNDFSYFYMIFFYIKFLFVLFNGFIVV